MENFDFNEINNYIHKVFNYYNGRINKVINAMLDINWIDDANLHIAGKTICTGMITIFPSIINKHCNDIKEFKFMILMTVIHELFHVDQYRLYSLYVTNQNYLQYTESTVETQTWEYILNHLDEVYTFVPGLDLNIKDVKSELLDVHSHLGLMFKRCTLEDYMCIVLDDLLRFDKQTSITSQNKYREYYNNKYSSIYITINGVSSTIKCMNITGETCYTSIETLQRFLYDAYFKYQCRTDINFAMVEDNDILLFEISFVGYNILVNRVNKKE